MLSTLYKIALVAFSAFTQFLFVNIANSQDLEPRSLSNTPIGGNFAIASYGYSTGNILADNALPIEELNAKLNIIVIAYARSFKMFNKLAKFDVIAPFSFGKFEGVVSNLDTSTSRVGFGDPLLRLSIFLIGNKPLSGNEFFNQERKKFNLGASVRVRVPVGQYDETKLINLGTNRWAVKLDLASSYTLNRKLVLEGQLVTWLFTENKQFYNGNSLRQKPLIAAQIHIAYIFKPGVWVAVSAGRSGKGETVLNGVERNDLQNNSRYGATFAYRIKNHNAIKLAFTSGISTRYGADFTTILMAYQFMWFDKN